MSMDRKWQPILISTILLLIGFTLGVLANRTYVNYRLNSYHHDNVRNELRVRIFKGLNLNDKQKKQIDPILDKHFKDMEQLRTAFRLKVDSLIISVDPYLTNEQKEILKKRHDSHQHRRKRRKPD